MDDRRDRLSGGRQRPRTFRPRIAPRPPTRGSKKALVLLVATGVALTIGVGGLVVVGGAIGAKAEEIVSCEASSVGTVKDVPENLAPIYEQAAARYELGPEGPSILAAINWVETGFGTNLGVSSAAAEGWMQFLPSSWAAYGVDANGDGVKDPYNPWDAIYAAARLLRASGAPGDWHGAIFAYNHAEWYVTKVFSYARRFRGAGAATASLDDCSVAAAPALQRMLDEADRIDALHLTYVWAGSHSQTPTPANGPFDCSSAVSHLLQVGGFRNPTMDTSLLISWGETGPGEAVTIHVRDGGVGSGHTFLEFAPGVTPPSKRYWGTSTTNPGGGPGWIPAGTMSAGYLASFHLRHPPGL